MKKLVTERHNPRLTVGCAIAILGGAALVFGFLIYVVLLSLTHSRPYTSELATALVLLVLVSFVAGGFVLAVAFPENRGGETQDIPPPTIPSTEWRCYLPILKLRSGRFMPFSIAPNEAPPLAFTATFVVGLMWNSFVLTIALPALRLGSNDQFTSTAVIFGLFFLPGLALLTYACRQLLQFALVPQPALEISAPALHPGGSVEAVLILAGLHTINKLTVELICEERATILEDKERWRTETYQTHCQILHETVPEHQVAVQLGKPVLQPLALSLAATATPSFRARFQEIRWSVRVRRRFNFWPAQDHHFTLNVLPTGIKA